MKRNGTDLKAHALECPDCGSGQVETRMAVDRFTYGVGPRAVDLEAEIPFRRCLDCQFEYTDSAAEDLRHEAICRHLGVMTPNDIVNVRRLSTQSRAEFSVLTKFGEASLLRWESGELIQNRANDNYLYLLQFPENVRRLRVRNEKREAVHESSVKAFFVRFKTLDPRTILMKREEASAFQL